VSPRVSASVDRRDAVAGHAVSPPVTFVAPAVAGMPFVHHVPAGMRIRPSPDERWLGSRVTDAPIVVEHRVGPASTEGMRRITDEGPYAAHFPYLLDANGDVVVGFEGAIDLPGTGPTHGFRQLLRTDAAGHRYVLEYERELEADWLQWTWQRIVLMHALPARGRGLVAHGTGFLLPDGRAVLCPGVSGAGKSTLARALRADAGASARLLSDDRLALTAEADGPRLWGTPWPSQADALLADDGALGAVVLLRKGSGGLVRDVTPREASRQLMRTLGFPFWSEERLASSLALLERVLERARLVEFTWAPVPGEAARLIEALMRDDGGQR
jgi:hypothetical protein